jgi:DNA-binding NtrC family response regulator
MVNRSRAAEAEGTEALRREPPRQPLGVVVRVVQGTASPTSFRLAAGSCRVGAGSDNDLVVVDKAVSRAHLELTLVAEGVLVRDLGSRNGTFYRGQRVGEITLAPGSRLTLGSTELCFESDLEDFEQTSAEGPSRYAALLGKTPSMRRLFALMRRLEGSLVNVLVEGESGTGKELVAKALHDHSQVAHNPFIAINCGALDRSLARSELFGHKKGAFTGAVSSSPGAFEEANGGTLFLDEVGELPLDVQPVLLRVLESGESCRVGESTGQSVKVRVIAATNRNLKDEVESGSFRADLYYRLMVVKLSVPPLRDRRDDIPVLANHFAAEVGLGVLPDAVQSELLNRDWPGNVRELKHALLAYSAVGMLQTPEQTPLGDLEAALRRVVDLTRPYTEQKDELVQRMTRIYLSGLIEHTSHNLSEAARIAGLQRGYMRKLLEKLGISRE